MRKGSKHSEEAKRKNSEKHKSMGVMPPSRKGCVPWNKGGTNPEAIHNPQTFKKGMTPWNKDKPYPRMLGVNNPAWKGGVTPVNHKIRVSLEYRLWRNAVFKRDNYTCIWCGYKSKGTRPVDIHADHIKPFAYFPELRFAIDNGRTLCIPCHRKTDTYGGHSRKKTNATKTSQKL